MIFGCGGLNCEGRELHASPFCSYVLFQSCYAQLAAVSSSSVSLFCVCFWLLIFCCGFLLCACVDSSLAQVCIFVSLFLFLLPVLAQVRAGRICIRILIVQFKRLYVQCPRNLPQLCSFSSGILSLLFSLSPHFFSVLYLLITNNGLYVSLCSLCFIVIVESLPICVLCSYFQD